MMQLILGDNQFFGVNHASEARAQEQSIKFQELDAIMAVLGDACEEGVRTFMCTTHDRVEQICDRVRSEPRRYEGMSFYPCMPYAHKYADAVTEEGPIGALRRFVPDGGLLDATIRGGRSVLGKDLEALTTLLVDAEMRPFHGLPTTTVFLQNVVVDLLLGLGLDEAFVIFADHVRDRYHARPGFITMNMPVMAAKAAELGITDATLCFNFNKVGFRMPGGVDAYRSTMLEHDLRWIAMSVFASGAIPAQEALEWACSHDALDGIVFGASSRSHIRSTASVVAGLTRGPSVNGWIGEASSALHGSAHRRVP